MASPAAPAPEELVTYAGIQKSRLASTRHVAIELDASVMRRGVCLLSRDPVARWSSRTDCFVTASTHFWGSRPLCRPSFAHVAMRGVAGRPGDWNDVENENISGGGQGRNSREWGDSRARLGKEKRDAGRTNGDYGDQQPSGPWQGLPAAAGVRQRVGAFFGMEPAVVEQVTLITVSSILMSTCHTILGPILPVYVKSFDLGQFGTFAAGASVSLFAVGRLLAKMPAGQMGDYFGRKAMLVWGPALTAVGMLMSGYVGSYWELLAWRFFTGIGSSIQMTGSQLFLGDISTPKNRARVMGTNQAASLLGLSIGPALGGYLAGTLGMTAPFTVTAVLAAGAAVYGQLRLPETHPQMASGSRDRASASAARATALSAASALESGTARAEADRQRKGPAPSRMALLRQLLGNKQFVSIMAVNATMFMSANGARNVLMPLHATEALHWQTSEVGALFSLMAIVNLAGLVPASWAADKWGRAQIIVPGMSVMGAALLIAALAPSPHVFTVAMVIYAIGQTACGSAPAAYAMDIFPEGARGAALGIYRSAGDVGLLLGPALLGLLSDRLGVAGGFVANGLMLVGCAVAFQLVTKGQSGRPKA